MTERSQRKQSVRKAFDRAARSYDQAAAVQREVCQRLSALASRHHPSGFVTRILDAGCGTGYGLDLIACEYPDASLIALDFAAAMLAQLPHSELTPDATPVCADLEALPFATCSIDGIWSSLAVQWCEPSLVIPEFARTLRPGGMAWIATLGPQTLIELRQAFAEIDQAEHVIRFHPAAQWIEQAEKAGFALVASDLRPAFALAPNLHKLLRDIKAIGAHSVGEKRRRKPLGRSAWQTLETRYDSYRRDDGLLPATYDLILLALEKRPAHD